VERILLERRLRCIPLRILVTGTRGKSSVVRLVASALREADYPTLAKTTGSRPVLIYPDGEEKTIHRKGQPTITEGKKLIKIAAELEARALVAEMMSIQPESSFVESRKVIQPHVVAVTNVRVDHVAQMGKSKDSVARCLATSISEKSTLLVPEEESFPVFIETARNLGARVIQIPSPSVGKTVHPFELEENRGVALAVTDFLGIDRDTAVNGMRRAEADLGALQAWTCDVAGRHLHLASLFAANDPESTRKALDWLLERKDLPRDSLYGLLTLRNDRGDRSLQWLEALAGDRFPELRGLFITGGHASALASRLRQRGKRPVFALGDARPTEVMAKIGEKTHGDILIVGMGNMGGVGKGLVDDWSRMGRRL
jgi:poly-gamma-glutamate synthase PgsB/CapB